MLTQDCNDSDDRLSRSTDILVDSRYRLGSARISACLNIIIGYPVHLNLIWICKGLSKDKPVMLNIFRLDHRNESE